MIKNMEQKIIKVQEDGFKAEEEAEERMKTI